MTAPGDSTGPRISRLLGGMVARLVMAVVAAGIVIGLPATLVVRSSAQATFRGEFQEEKRAAAQRLAAEFDSTLTAVGRSVAIAAASVDTEELRANPRLLARSLRVLPSFDSLAAYSADGTVLGAADTRRLVNPAELDRRPDAVKGLESQRPNLRIVTDGVPMLEVIAPIESPPGTIVGALLGRAPLEIVARGVQAGFVGKTAVAFVVSNDGTILAHPARDVVLRGERYGVRDVLSAERAITIERPGGEVVASAAPVSSLDAAVVVEQDAGEVYAPISDELRDITLFALVGTVLGGLMLGVIATRLMRPLADLGRTVERIGAGDRTARATSSGSRELRAVAEQINRMADALDHRMEELEAAQRELAAAEARFRAAFDQAPVAMGLSHFDGTFVEVNPAMGQLLGRGPEACVGLGWRELTHPDDVADSERMYDALRASGGRTYQIEKRYMHVAGYPVWVLLSAAIVKAADGSRLVVSHVQDITDKRRAADEREALLRTAVEAEDRTQRVLDAAPDATVVVNTAGIVTYVNRQVAAVFGYGPGELLGQPVELLLPDRFRAGHEQHRAGYVREPRARLMGESLDLWGRQKDGTEFPVEVSLSPLVVEGETHVVASARDVSERRRGEETTLTLETMRVRQRQAVELNDNIVQGLTVAKWAFERGRLEESRRAVEQTLDAAQALIQRMLREASAVDLGPGDLVRDRPAELGS